MTEKKGYFFDWALIQNEWQKNVYLSVNGFGHIDNIVCDTTKPHDAEYFKNQALLPAIPNCHSHAFQRAIAGLTETKSHKKDNFWSWREQMYKFVRHINPEDAYAIAALAYMEMLESGFSCVGEFHYLHNTPQGERYLNPSEMSQSIIQAAKDTGIGLTLLPVFYQFGGADKRPLNPQQKRFYNDSVSFQKLLSDLETQWSELPKDYRLGLAPHSLRAIPNESLHEIPSWTEGPIHIHIAEQTAEVDEIKKTLGKRPVEWLYDNTDVNKRWCLIHATHITAQEIQLINSSKAVAGLCPITEANLGDGLFPLETFLENGGLLAIGSDSNVSINLAEELRLLEYGQRLSKQQRCISAEYNQSVGTFLLDKALKGGSQSLDRNIQSLQIGGIADMLTLDLSDVTFIEKPSKYWIDSWIFTARNPLPLNVWSAGRHCVKNSRHINKNRIINNYRKSLKKLIHL